MTDSDLRFMLRSDGTLLAKTYALRQMAADGSEGGVIATFRGGIQHSVPGVVVYADEAMTTKMFMVGGDVFTDKYEITDENGAVIGSFRKRWKASFLRTTWHLETADGMTALGRERSRVLAIVRRMFDEIPFMPFHFDFRTDDGQIVLSSVRRRKFLAEYVLTVPVLRDGRRLDWRAAVAMGIALEVFQER